MARTKRGRRADPAARLFPRDPPRDADTGLPPTVQEQARRHVARLPVPHPVEPPHLLTRDSAVRGQWVQLTHSCVLLGCSALAAGATSSQLTEQACAEAVTILDEFRTIIAEPDAVRFSLNRIPAALVSAFCQLWPLLPASESTAALLRDSLLPNLLAVLEENVRLSAEAQSQLAAQLPANPEATERSTQLPYLLWVTTTVVHLMCTKAAPMQPAAGATPAEVETQAARRWEMGCTVIEPFLDEILSVASRALILATSLQSQRDNNLRARRAVVLLSLLLQNDRLASFMSAHPSSQVHLQSLTHTCLLWMEDAHYTYSSCLDRYLTQQVETDGGRKKLKPRYPSDPCIPLEDPRLETKEMTQQAQQGHMILGHAVGGALLQELLRGVQGEVGVQIAESVWRHTERAFSRMDSGISDLILRASMRAVEELLESPQESVVRGHSSRVHTLLGTLQRVMLKDGTAYPLSTRVARVVLTKLLSGSLPQHSQERDVPLFFDAARAVLLAPDSSVSQRTGAIKVLNDSYSLVPRACIPESVCASLVDLAAVTLFGAGGGDTLNAALSDAQLKLVSRLIVAVAKITSEERPADATAASMFNPRQSLAGQLLTLMTRVLHAATPVVTFPMRGQLSFYGSKALLSLLPLPSRLPCFSQLALCLLPNSTLEDRDSQTKRYTPGTLCLRNSMLNSCSVWVESLGEDLPESTLASLTALIHRSLQREYWITPPTDAELAQEAQRREKEAKQAAALAAKQVAAAAAAEAAALAAGGTGAGVAPGAFGFYPAATTPMPFNPFGNFGGGTFAPPFGFAAFPPTGIAPSAPPFPPMGTAAFAPPFAAPFANPFGMGANSALPFAPAFSYGAPPPAPFGNGNPFGSFSVGVTSGLPLAPSSFADHPMQTAGHTQAVGAYNPSSMNAGAGAAGAAGQFVQIDPTDAIAPSAPWPTPPGSASHVEDGAFVRLLASLMRCVPKRFRGEWANSLVQPMNEWYAAQVCPGVDLSPVITALADMYRASSDASSSTVAPFAATDLPRRSRALVARILERNCSAVVSDTNASHAGVLIALAHVRAVLDSFGWSAWSVHYTGQPGSDLTSAQTALPSPLNRNRRIHHLIQSCVWLVDAYVPPPSRRGGGESNAIRPELADKFDNEVSVLGARTAVNLQAPTPEFLPSDHSAARIIAGIRHGGAEEASKSIIRCAPLEWVRRRLVCMRALPADHVARVESLAAGVESHAFDLLHVETPESACALARARALALLGSVAAAGSFGRRWTRVLLRGECMDGSRSQHPELVDGNGFLGVLRVVAEECPALQPAVCRYIAVAAAALGSDPKDAPAALPGTVQTPIAASSAFAVVSARVLSPQTDDPSACTEILQDAWQIIVAMLDQTTTAATLPVQSAAVGAVGPFLRAALSVVDAASRSRALRGLSALVAFVLQSWEARHALGRVPLPNPGRAQVMCNTTVASLHAVLVQIDSELRAWSSAGGMAWDADSMKQVQVLSQRVQNTLARA